MKDRHDKSDGNLCIRQNTVIATDRINFPLELGSRLTQLTQTGSVRPAAMAALAMTHFATGFKVGSLMRRTVHLQQPPDRSKRCETVG